MVSGQLPHIMQEHFKKITSDCKSGKFGTQVMFSNKFIVQYCKNLHVTIDMEKRLYLSRLVNDFHG